VEVKYSTRTICCPDADQLFNIIFTQALLLLEAMLVALIGFSITINFLSIMRKDTAPMQQQPNQSSPNQPSNPWSYRWDGPPPSPPAYPAQQPFTPPPVYMPQLQPSQPAPKKRWSGWLLPILTFFAGLLIGAVLFHGSSTPTSTPPTTQSGQPTSSAQQTTSAPAASSQHLKVGQSVQTGAFQVTVNGVKTSQGQSFDTPKTGHVFLLIDVTVKNTSSQEQDVSSLVMWTLRDTSGQAISPTITTFAPPAPDGKVEAGNQIRGTLAYEVPTSQHTFTLAFIPDLTSGQTIWDISI
jgi:hypothetical protein